MAAIVRTPVITAVDTTTSTTIPSVLSASCSFGYDIHVATAEIHVPPTSLTGLNYWDDLQLTLGTNRESHVRFKGFITGFDWTLYPVEVAVKCSGHLILADRFENQQAGGTQVAGTGAGAGLEYGHTPFTPGLTDAPLTATVNPATLDGICKLVLNLCGITVAMVTDGVTGHSTILGTGQVLGTVAVQDYLWSQGENGLSYLQRIEEIALGYRSFDVMDGTIARKMVSTVIGLITAWSSVTAYVIGNMVSQGGVNYICILGNTNQLPPNATYWKVLVTFTEGVDIFSGKSPRSVLPLRNGVLAQGYTESNGSNHTSARSLASTYVPTPPGTIWQDLTSRLMECTNPLDIALGVGISCYSAAGWLLNELNQLQVKLDMETFREDLISPGDIVAIAAPTRLNLATTPLWVQHVDVSVSDKGAFTQRLGCLRGA